MKLCSALIVIFLISGCDSSIKEKKEVSKVAPKLIDKNFKALIPEEPGQFRPSMAKLDGAYNRDVHLQGNKCGECHQDISLEWKDSVHAIASLNNPYYKVSLDAFAKDSGQDKTTFCAGCHDPVLMFSNTIKKGIDVEDPASYAGITCTTCHGITKATTEGNASYSLNTSPIVFPEESGVGLDKHRKRLKTIEGDGLCASCHIGFFTPESGHAAVLPGLNEYAPWRASGYNSNPTTRLDEVDAQTCVGCHMPKIVNPVTKISHISHRFAGGHSTLAAAISSKEQLLAVKKMVQSAATINIAAVGIGDIKVQDLKAVKKGDVLWIDVVVFNKNTGHRFPGGAQDLRDTWIELEIFDAKNNLLASAGTEHEKSMKDPTAVRLKATVSGPDGEIVKGHQVAQLRTAIFNRTITPRDARVARYKWGVDSKIAHPLTLKARLRHRRLDASLFDAACEASKTKEGKSFREKSKKYTGTDLDPCIRQPVIEIDDDKYILGPGQPVSHNWETQYRRALGLLKQVQESLEEAEDALRSAEKLSEKASKFDQARILFLLAKVMSRQGRTEDAMDYFEKCEKLVGSKTAIDFARGLAQQRTFHNDKAEKWFERAAAKTSDDRIFRKLAIASGSIMKAQSALHAAQLGLAIEPRDSHLLRSQMLALKKLNKKEAAIAFKAFSRYKKDESSGKIKKNCIGKSEECRLARQPIPVIQMRETK